ncbi:uncharacterized protein N7518_005526 [Penicillium psychrosexuale]|uniref:uncharacterized protein n=1 Tax=Penicillium psychrosexuale TaxID=1002107 RepID=UPI00254524FF|nr:uncharacterized protein N7518_005526 [Penicillium psychrosexuale]KAJ5796986.1 hypothetical protein N7518_005526 [Penicillium psychrosexuale]
MPPQVTGERALHRERLEKAISLSYQLLLYFEDSTRPYARHLSSEAELYIQQIAPKRARQQPSATASLPDQTQTDQTQTRGIGTISLDEISLPETNTLELNEDLTTAQAIRKLVRIDASATHPEIMKAAYRLEALAAACAVSPNASVLLQNIRQHGLSDTDADTLFTLTYPPVLPTYAQAALANAHNPEERAVVRDALRFIAGQNAFANAIESSEGPATQLFRQLSHNWETGNPNIITNSPEGAQEPRAP